MGASDTFRFVESTRIVTGYHATTVAGAQSIIESETFVRKAADYHWLGQGVYFWDSMYRAWQWVDQKFKSLGAIIEVDIVLGFHLDCNLTEHQRYAQDARILVEKEFAQKSVPTPVNTNKAKRLNCAVFDYIGCHADPRLDTLTGIFQDGEEMIPGSWIHTGSHVQFCVRDTRVIKRPLKMHTSRPTRGW